VRDDEKAMPLWIVGRAGDRRRMEGECICDASATNTLFRFVCLQNRCLDAIEEEEKRRKAEEPSLSRDDSDENEDKEEKDEEDVEDEEEDERDGWTKYICSVLPALEASRVLAIDVRLTGKNESLVGHI